MNDVELERRARRAADSLRREANMFAAPEVALAELLEHDSRDATGDPRSMRLDDHVSVRRRTWLALTCAAAIIVLVVGVAIVSQRSAGERPALDQSPEVAPSTDPLTAPPGPDWDGIAVVDAQVIGVSPDSVDARIEIDRGSVHGVVVGMPVINAAGLVGHMTTVFPDTSIVTLLSSGDIGVGAKSISTGSVPDITASGIVSGQGGDEHLHFDVQSGTLPSVGDAVLTLGGTDSLEPPDIPIGRIVNVTEEGTGDVEPAADLSRLDHVQVLLYRPPVPTGAVPTELPAAHAIWSITNGGRSGTIRPLDPATINSDREIAWHVGSADGLAPEANDETIELDNGSTARYQHAPSGYQLITWQQDSGAWIVVTSTSADLNRDEFLELANSFKPATPSDVNTTRQLIATNVQAMFDLAHTARIDDTEIELYALGGDPVALCIAADRCEVALGPVGRIRATDPVAGFSFQNAEGSVDHYALMRGSFERLEPSEGVTIRSQSTDDGIWVHAHRPAGVPAGSVNVVNPSEELNGLIGFDV